MQIYHTETGLRHLIQIIQVVHRVITFHYIKQKIALRKECKKIFFLRH